MTKYGIEAPLESLEEAVNVFSEREGRIAGGLEEDKRGIIDRFISSAFSDEGILSMSLGAIGGIGNIAAVDNMPSIKKTEGKLGYGLGPSQRQQEVEQKKKQYAGSLLSLKEDLTDFVTQNDELKKAAESGDVTKMEEAKEKLFNIAARRSVVDGVGEYLIGTLQEVKDVDNTKIGQDGKTDAMRQGLTQSLSDNSYKTKADEKINEIKFLQEQFNDHFNKFNSKDTESPGYLKYVFSAYVDSHSAKKIYENNLSEYRKAEMSFNSLKMSMNDIIIAEEEEVKLKKIKEFSEKIKKSPEYLNYEAAKSNLEKSMTALDEANEKYAKALDFELYKKKLNGFVEENTKAAVETKVKTEERQTFTKELFDELERAGYKSPEGEGIGRRFVFEMTVKDEEGNDKQKDFIAERVRDPKTNQIKVLIKDPETGEYLTDKKDKNIEFDVDYYIKNKDRISIISMDSYQTRRRDALFKKRRDIQAEALQAVITDYNEEVSALNKQINESEEAIKEANKQIEELQNDLAKHIKDRTYKLNKKEINRKIKELNKTIKTLKDNITSLENTRDAIFPKLEALRALQEEVASVSTGREVSIALTIQDTAEALEAQATPVEETLKNLEDLLSNMEDAILTMREEVEKLEKIVAEIEDILKDSEYISALQGRVIMEATFRSLYPDFPLSLKNLYKDLKENRNREVTNAYLSKIAIREGKRFKDLKDEFIERLKVYDEAQLKAQERFELEEELNVANSKLLALRKSLKEHLDTYVAKAEERNNLVKLKLIADNLQSEVENITVKAQFISARKAVEGKVKQSQLTPDSEVADPSEATVINALDTFLSSNLFYTTGSNVEYEVDKNGKIIGTKYDEDGNPIIKSGYQKGWFAFLDKFTNLFKEDKTPYRLKLFIRTDPNTPANVKALMDKEVGDKGSDLDIGAFLVNDKGEFIYINDKGEFDPAGYPAFTFLPKIDSLLSEKGPKVNWKGLAQFFIESNPQVRSYPSIEKKSDSDEVKFAGEDMTVAEYKSRLLENAKNNYQKFIDQVVANQSSGAFVDIETVSNGIALRQLNTDKTVSGKYKYQPLDKLLEQRGDKVKKIHIADSKEGAVVINGYKYFYKPGTVLVELEDGTYFPVFTDTLSDEDVQTTLQLIHRGKTNFDERVDLPEGTFTLDSAKSIRIFPKSQSNRFSLLANLINWGKDDYRVVGPSPDLKYEIYIQGGKVWFKNPLANYIPTSISVNDVLNPNKNIALVALLKEKKYNVSKAALNGGNYFYFHPKYDPKTGKLYFKRYKNYNEYLLSKLRTFTFANADGQMMASKNIVLKTDNFGMPVVNNKSVERQEFAISPEDFIQESGEDVDIKVSESMDLDDLQAVIDKAKKEGKDVITGGPGTETKVMGGTIQEEEIPTTGLNTIKKEAPTTTETPVSTADNTKTPIEGLNERLDSYGNAKVLLPSDYYEGARPAGRLNAFKAAVDKIAENLITLANVNFNEFDFLSKDDKTKLDELKLLAEELRKINTNDISSSDRRTVAVEKRYAALTNQLANEFVAIIGKHVEQQLGKKITSSKPKLVTSESKPSIAEPLSWDSLTEAVRKQLKAMGTSKMEWDNSLTESEKEQHLKNCTK